MTKQDRQKLSILVVLIAVLGLTVVLGYRMNQPATTAAVQAPEPKMSTNPPAATGETKIRLDLVEKHEAAEEDIGKKNVFQYRQTPLPGSRPGVPVAGPSPVPANPGSPPTPVRQGPPQPPPPPPIPLKYQGFATVTATGGGLTAFLADDSRHYNVTVGEVLMGRFRIVSISDKAVEIEDLEYNKRQTLPLMK